MLHFYMNSSFDVYVRVRARAIVKSPHSTDKDVTVLQLFPTKQDRRQDKSMFHINAFIFRHRSAIEWNAGGDDVASGLTVHNISHLL